MDFSLRFELLMVGKRLWSSAMVEAEKKRSQPEFGGVLSLSPFSMYSSCSWSFMVGCLQL
jgi:hypothetical protein